MSEAMQKIRIEKVTLNVGAGKDSSKLENGMILIKDLVGISPVKTYTTKRIPTWGLRPGLPVGCKLTLRGEKAKEILTRILEGKNNTLKKNNFDSTGNLAFGIHEYIDIPTLKYNPKIGIMGFEVCVTFEKPGFRVKNRKAKISKVGKNQQITKQEAIDFMKENYKINLDE